MIYFSKYKPFEFSGKLFKYLRQSIKDTNTKLKKVIFIPLWLVAIIYILVSLFFELLLIATNLLISLLLTTKNQG